nr:hypothetical protein [Tanacetum cinerariifolium]
MNVAQPKRTSFAKITHSYVKRPFQGKTSVRNQFRVPRVPTVNKNSPTVDIKVSTVKSTFTTGLGNKGKAVKALACWIWRLKQNTTDKGPNINSVLVIFKKYQDIDTQGRLKLLGQWLLSTHDCEHYEPYDGGYVSFGQGGGKITGKGISKDVLVDVASYVYPLDFVILDIKEFEKRPFILGTSFLTTAKAVIKFDKGTITSRSGKSNISFHRIPKSICKIKKGIKNDIEPIAPTMTVNRLILEWEERIKLHQEKEIEFDQ